MSEPRIRHILVAVALCEHSRTTLERAAQIAGESGASVTVLHVLRTPELPRPTTTEALRAQRRMHWFARNAAQRGLERLLEASGLGGRVETIVRAGDPAVVIPDECRRVGADLLVLGPRHHRGFARLFFGSSAERLRGRLPCRTLTAGDAAVPA